MKNNQIILDQKCESFKYHKKKMKEENIKYEMKLHSNQRSLILLYLWIFIIITIAITIADDGDGGGGGLHCV